MTFISIADARAGLSQVIDDAISTHERFDITRNGQPVAVILSREDYETMQETIEILSDQALVKDHLTGLAEINSGDYVDADQLTAALRRQGRIS